MTRHLPALSRSSHTRGGKVVPATCRSARFQMPSRRPQKRGYGSQVLFTKSLSQEPPGADQVRAVGLHSFRVPAVLRASQ